jgi:hypothetical protein
MIKQKKKIPPRYLVDLSQGTYEVRRSGSIRWGNKVW